MEKTKSQTLGDDGCDCWNPASYISLEHPTPTGPCFSVSFCVRLVVYSTNICHWGKLEKNGCLEEASLEVNLKGWV